MDYYSYYGWKPYVSVASRRAQAARAAAALRKNGRQVSPVVIEGRAIATTFWGEAWCDNLERYSDFANRLPRGRSYVRNGSVIDLRIARGVVTALVSGSSVYRVRLKVAPLPPARWRALCRTCTGAIDSVVELLQGRLSEGVLAHICAPKTGLFPAPTEIAFRCSCPDWAWMCKHVAAVLYGVGARLDERPDWLFLLRGVDAQDLIARADTGLRPAKKGRAAGRVLDGGDLSEIFDIEIAPAARPAAKADRRRDQAPAGPARPAPTRGRAARPSPARQAGSVPGRVRPPKGVTPAAFRPPAGWLVPRPAPGGAAKPPSRRRPPRLSAAQRAAITARMKAYWRERRKRIPAAAPHKGDD
jgi:uncharacterized Zn finger protein